MLEDICVVFVDAELRAGTFLRFEILADAERPVGIDAPRELDPELVLFPHFARVHGARIVNVLAEPFARRLSQRGMAFD